MRKAIVSKQVGGLNLREAPGDQGRVVDVAKPGDVVEVLTRLQSGWVYVSYKGQTGYMWGRDLEDLPAGFIPDIEEVEEFEDRVPVWIWLAGAATLAIGLVAAIWFILR